MKATFERALNWVETALNWVKDAYLVAVDWIDNNPQKTLWIAFALIVGGLVL